MVPYIWRQAQSCRKVKPINGIRCQIDEARITPGANLQARYVIYTVGPKYKIDNDPEALLRSAYKNSLDLAISNNCISIAFPAISCGIYGYPAIEVAHIALGLCQREEYTTLKIYFYLYGKKMLDLWKSTLVGNAKTLNINE